MVLVVLSAGGKEDFVGKKINQTQKEKETERGREDSLLLSLDLAVDAISSLDGW